MKSSFLFLMLLSLFTVLISVDLNAQSNCNCMDLQIEIDPTTCGSKNFRTVYKNYSRLSIDSIKKFVWDFGPGFEQIVGSSDSNRSAYKNELMTVRGVYRGVPYTSPGVYTLKLIVETYSGCIDSAEATTRIYSKSNIASHFDTLYNQSSLFWLEENEIYDDPSIEITWNVPGQVVDPSSDTIKAYDLDHGDIDIKVTVQLTSPAYCSWGGTLKFHYSALEAHIQSQSSGKNNMVEKEIYQCDSRDTVHFSNHSQHPINSKRISRIWDMGDRYAPQCTTITIANINVGRNCNYSRDSLPSHMYTPWSQLFQDSFYGPNVPIRIAGLKNGQIKYSSIDTTSKNYEKYFYELIATGYTARIKLYDSTSKVTSTDSIRIRIGKPRADQVGVSYVPHFDSYDWWPQAGCINEGNKGNLFPKKYSMKFDLAAQEGPYRYYEFNRDSSKSTFIGISDTTFGLRLKGRSPIYFPIPIDINYPKLKELSEYAISTWWRQNLKTGQTVNPTIGIIAGNGFLPGKSTPGCLDTFWYTKTPLIKLHDPDFKVSEDKLGCDLSKRIKVQMLNPRQRPRWVYIKVEDNRYYMRDIPGIVSNAIFTEDYQKCILSPDSSSKYINQIIRVLMVNDKPYPVWTDTIIVARYDTVLLRINKSRIPSVLHRAFQNAHIDVHSFSGEELGMFLDDDTIGGTIDTTGMGYYVQQAIDFVPLNKKIIHSLDTSMNADSGGVYTISLPDSLGKTFKPQMKWVTVRLADDLPYGFKVNQNIHDRSKPNSRVQGVPSSIQESELLAYEQMSKPVGSYSDFYCDGYQAFPSKVNDIWMTIYAAHIDSTCLDSLVNSIISATDTLGDPYKSLFSDFHELKANICYSSKMVWGDSVRLSNGSDSILVTMDRNNPNSPYLQPFIQQIIGNKLNSMYFGYTSSTERDTLYPRIIVNETNQCADTFDLRPFYLLGRNDSAMGRFNFHVNKKIERSGCKFKVTLTNQSFMSSYADQCGNVSSPKYYNMSENLIDSSRMIYINNDTSWESSTGTLELDTGIHKFRLVLWNYLGKSDSIDFQIVLDEPIIGNEKSVIRVSQSNDTLTLSVDKGDSNLMAIWSVSGVGKDTGFVVDLAVPDTGNYGVTLILSDTVNGCSVMVNDTIHISGCFADLKILQDSNYYTYNFTATSFGESLMHNWDLYMPHDTFKSHNAIFIKSFDTAEVVKICLRSSNKVCSDDTCTKLILSGPVARYRSRADSNFYTIRFTDSSEGKGLNYLWQLTTDTGTYTSTNSSFVYRFDTSGEYKICLTVKNALGKSSTCDTVLIPGCKARFLQITDSNFYTFNFIDSSDGLDMTHMWTLQTDTGLYSTSDSIFKYAFDTSGKYPVCLKVENDICQDNSCDTVIVPGCEADFHYKYSNKDPYIVEFTDSSSGPDLMVKWEMGNGVKLNDSADFIFDFDTAGVYRVCLVSENAVCLSQACDSILLDPPGWILFNTGYVLTGLPDCSYNVLITDSSEVMNWSDSLLSNSDSVVQRRWFWDSNDSSTIGNNLMINLQPGKTNMTLVSKTWRGRVDSVTFTMNVPTPKPLSKALSFAFNMSGSLVNFTNRQRLNDCEYLWSFGDGDSAVALDTSHSYNLNGKYRVCLKSIDTATLCSAETCDSVWIGSCDAGFYIKKDSKQKYGVYLIDTSTGSNLKYEWDFGDGSTKSNDTLPTHEYDTFGSYLVCLTVSNNYCSSTFCDSVGMDSSGALLKTGGFVIIVLDRSRDTATLVEDLHTPTGLIHLYPNPTTGHVIISSESIDLSRDVTINLVSSDSKNIEFKPVRTEVTELELEFDVVDGVYYLEVLTSGHVISRHKVIVIKE